MADRRRIEGNFNQGWPYALFITALAVGAFILAGTIKRSTFHDPHDPLGPSAGSTAAPQAKN